MLVVVERNVEGVALFASNGGGLTDVIRLRWSLLHCIAGSPG